MQQNVTVSRFLCHDFKRCGIAADHDHLIRSREFKAVAFKCPVTDWECLYRYPVIPVDHARLNFRCFYFVPHFICFFKAVDAEIDIHCVSLLDITGHFPDALWAKHLQRLFPLQHPRGKDQVRIPGCVVGMQMRTEGHSQAVRAQGIHPLLIGLCSLTDHTRPKINQVCPVSYNNCGRWSAGIGARVRRAGAKKYKFCFHNQMLPFLFFNMFDGNSRKSVKNTE